jgi:hypothetical protein
MAVCEGSGPEVDSVHRECVMSVLKLLWEAEGLMRDKPDYFTFTEADDIDGLISSLSIGLGSRVRPLR